MRLRYSVLWCIFAVHVLVILRIVQWRYDPLYAFRNAVFFGGRDPTNFRPRAFFEEGYLDGLMDARGMDAPFHITSERNVHVNHSRIIAYSLYGDAEKYRSGMLHNVRVVHERMPGWTVRMYVHDDVPSEYTVFDPRVEIVRVYDTVVKASNGAGTFWRFLALCEEDKDVVIVDADNKLDPPQIDEILHFFESPGPPYLFADRTWPWPPGHVRAGLILKKKGYRHMPFTAAQVMHWPLREPFGSDEYFTTVMLGELVSLRELKIRHDASVYFVRNRVFSSLGAVHLGSPS